MQDIQLFRSLVSNQNGTPVTTSTRVAKIFGKQHKNVLRAIENLDCSSEFRRLNFELCFEINDLQNGKPNRYFNITKDGAAFLIMGFTGEKAGKFKEDYINAFNWMQETLQRRREIDLELGEFCKKESVSVANGSFHGKGLARRRKEKRTLSVELKEIKEKLQIALDLIESK